MSDKKTQIAPPEVLRSMATLDAEEDVSREEAEQELRAEGVNVDAFVERLMSKVGQEVAGIRAVRSGNVRAKRRTRSSRGDSLRNTPGQDAGAVAYCEAPSNPDSDEIVDAMIEDAERSSRKP